MSMPPNPVPPSTCCDKVVYYAEQTRPGRMIVIALLTTALVASLFIPEEHLNGAATGATFFLLLQRIASHPDSIVAQRWAPRQWRQILTGTIILAGAYVAAFHLLNNNPRETAFLIPNQAHGLFLLTFAPIFAMGITYMESFWQLCDMTAECLQERVFRIRPENYRRLPGAPQNQGPHDPV
ncbi:MAG: hypothetical protein KGJ02_02500 [Verrucomicrobiota bacterium]|nr:hypothetical protein [Verrucomicrobiota bacterium]